jgi:large subunit ribosomal protein L23
MITPVSIIKRVIISEKATTASSKSGQYVMEVVASANKVSVRQAVEAAFKGVKVAWVHIVRTPEKVKRILTHRGGYSIHPGFKKAIVGLKEGKIELN